MEHFAPEKLDLNSLFEACKVAPRFFSECTVLEVCRSLK